MNLCTVKWVKSDKTHAYVCTASVHNTTQNSSDNLPSYLQTNIIAQMLSTGGEGDLIGNPHF